MSLQKKGQSRYNLEEQVEPLNTFQFVNLTPWALALANCNSSCSYCVFKKKIIRGLPKQQKLNTQKVPNRT